MESIESGRIISNIGAEQPFVREAGSVVTDEQSSIMIKHATR